jgi:signal transduction histidine kinase
VRSVRVRTTVAAVVVVGLAMALSAIALSALLRRSLVGNLQTSAELRAEDVASLVRNGRAPDSIASPHDQDRRLVQVVDETGRVKALSPELAEKGLIPQFLPPGRTLMTRVLKQPSFENDEDFLVAARRVAPSGGAVHGAVVYVAASLQGVNQTVATVDRILILGVPMVLLAVCITSWLVMGRALHPVEAMRAEVAEITVHDLSRRVPEPRVDNEIARLARTMNAMLDRLQTASDRQRRFVADASHELQSPLASVRAQLEVGLADADSTDWRTTVNDVLDEQERMERLVQDLLFIARADEWRSPVREDLVDLDDLVLEEALRVRSRGRVRVNLARLSGGQVAGDADQLLRVIRNLLGNAERHARTTVDVALHTDGPTVELVVSDDGDGIPPADRTRVFERFTRLDNARARSQGGAGLGLAIAKEIVDSHGGTIAVGDSEVGTRIAVRLPTAYDARAAEPLATERQTTELRTTALPVTEPQPTDAPANDVQGPFSLEPAGSTTWGEPGTTTGKSGWSTR